jgi:hypothetical protein
MKQAETDGRISGINSHQLRYSPSVEKVPNASDLPGNIATGSLMLLEPDAEAPLPLEDGRFT